MTHTKKYYFASDVHLGLPNGHPQIREQRFVSWLDSIKHDAEAIYLLGDIFDFWCEYKEVAPRGFVRTLGKLAELTDSGIEVHFFAGNHDMWFTDYLSKEVGLVLHRKALVAELYGKTFYLSHGDELNFYDRKHRFYRSLFTSRILQFMLRAVHPRWVLAFAHRWSRNNRNSKGIAIPFRGEDEALVQFARKHITQHTVNYFIFGHLHTPIQMALASESQFFILGEWIQGGEYAVFDGEQVLLEKAF